MGRSANTVPNPMYLNEALTAVHNLESGDYGLEDGSRPGDWRLPTKSEWEAFFDTNYSYPALSNTAGDGQLTDGNPFILNSYDHPLFWTQTFFDSINIYIADVNLGETKLYPFYTYQFRAWPVRDDQPNP